MLGNNNNNNEKEKKPDLNFQYLRPNQVFLEWSRERLEFDSEDQVLLFDIFPWLYNLTSTLTLTDGIWDLKSEKNKE